MAIKQANVTFDHAGHHVEVGDLLDSTHVLYTLFPSRFTDGGVALSSATVPPTYTSNSPLAALTKLSGSFTAKVIGVDLTDSRLLAVDTTNAALKQSTDWGTTWSNSKTLPTNVTVAGGVGYIVRFGDSLYLTAKDNSDGLWKVWKSLPQSGNTAFSWGSPLLSTVTNATLGQPVMNTDGTYLWVGEYGDPVGGPSLYRTTDGTTWTTVYGPDAGIRHIHCIAPDPFNPGHVWMTCGDGIAKSIQRSTDNGTTWSIIVASSVWQGVQISFSSTYIYIAGDSQVCSVIVLDRATFTPRSGSLNRHTWLAVPQISASKTWDPASVADGAQVNTTVTLTGAITGKTAVAATFTTAVPAGMSLTAQVTATDTVTVTLVNHSGAPVDLASGTLWVTSVGGQFYGNAYYGMADPATGIYYCAANDTSVAGNQFGWFILMRPGDLLVAAEATASTSVVYIGGGYVFSGNYRHALLTAA